MFTLRAVQVPCFYIVCLKQCMGYGPFASLQIVCFIDWNSQGRFCIYTYSFTVEVCITCIMLSLQDFVAFELHQKQ